ncbi:MAG: lipoprotein signal peptidase [Odoribacteraceae bacterium]|jgi:signal peptidase II|nr:lipoprotein signal peptidase [Odoribacteraceae bacterium]
MKNKHIITLAAALLLLDQALKIWIKTHMTIGQEYTIIADWFKIHFLENPGMAFGLQLGGVTGKILLTTFRLAAVAAIAWYITRLNRREAPAGLVACFTLVLCGALGNIIDSIFYGAIFTTSEGQIATLFPAAGYAPLLQGRVVDMLYFPLFQGYLPSWVPLWGGDYFIFFRPVFNLADSYITTGVIALLLFYRKFFSNKKTS